MLPHRDSFSLHLYWLCLTLCISDQLTPSVLSHRCVQLDRLVSPTPRTSPAIAIRAAKARDVKAWWCCHRRHQTHLMTHFCRRLIDDQLDRPHMHDVIDLYHRNLSTPNTTTHRRIDCVENECRRMRRIYIHRHRTV